MRDDERNIREKSQRRFARIKVSLQALVKVEVDDGRELFHAETNNLRRGGACLRVEDKTPEMLQLVDNMSHALSRAHDVSTGVTTGKTVLTWSSGAG